MDIKWKENRLNYTVRKDCTIIVQSTHPLLMLNFDMDENFQLQGVATPSWISHKEGMSKCFPCLESLCWVITEEPLQEINQIASRVINMLHY